VISHILDYTPGDAHICIQHGVGVNERAPVPASFLAGFVFYDMGGGLMPPAF